MSFLARLRTNSIHQVVSPLGSKPVTLHNNTVMSKPGPAATRGDIRQSNGLKDFLWQLSGIGKGTLLDTGPAWQTTLNFFIERGFKVYSEDVLTGWRDHLRDEEARLRALPAGADRGDTSADARAESFLRENLKYPKESFDAVLVWDLLDYLEPAAATRVVARLSDLVRTGGAVLGVFHVKKPESFQRYRVHDAQSLELITAPPLLPPQHIYQNREIQNLFSRFDSSRTFVGRDQLRENTFVR
jgi:hypothetical protein